MRLSKLFGKTLREEPAEAETASHRLMLKAGLIYQVSAGIYSYMPLAWRSLRKVEQIIREEMDAAGAQELRMPVLQPRELWDASGRSHAFGPNLFNLKDRRDRPMVLAPTIVSVDAPLTNMIATRIDKTVHYIGDIFPREIIIQHRLIQQAPKELNRAGACDIASIHTALFDWQLAHDEVGEAYDAEAAALARQCLEELDRNAEEVYNVTPKGIDTIVDLFRREVEFCARIGTSRPEEGSEHIVAYALEHLTRRHFLHGDLVGLGIFTMSRLQENEPEWVTELIRRCGLRYTAPGASRGEVRQCLETLKTFNDSTDLFYSIVNKREMSPEFIDQSLADLYAG